MDRKQPLRPKLPPRLVTDIGEMSPRCGSSAPRTFSIQMVGSNPPGGNVHRALGSWPLSTHLSCQGTSCHCARRSMAVSTAWCCARIAQLSTGSGPAPERHKEPWQKREVLRRDKLVHQGPNVGGTNVIFSAEWCQK